ncbi:MAG: 50S ribosomal protein L22 [Patescibacteria group bacterium]|nr:50S ribosomal protein L22 [Patescibacteria group bacterium]
MLKPFSIKLNYLHITPRKTRAIAQLLKGLSLNEAEAKLMVLPHRAAAQLLKLVRSGLADAKHNFKVEPATIFIKEVRVDQGPKYKRWTPRARGSANLIEKKTSRVTLILAQSDKLVKSRFNILEKPKKKKDEKRKKEEVKIEDNKEPRSHKELPYIKHDEKSKEEIKSTAKKGIFQKVFRRKSV